MNRESQTVDLKYVDLHGCTALIQYTEHMESIFSYIDAHKKPHLMVYNIIKYGKNRQVPRQKGTTTSIMCFAILKALEGKTVGVAGRRLDISVLKNICNTSLLGHTTSKNAVYFGSGGSVSVYHSPEQTRGIMFDYFIVDCVEFDVTMVCSPIITSFKDW